MKKIQDLKKGDFFKKSETAKIVFVKQHYAQSSKRYAANKFDDINDYQFFKKDTLVFVDFEF